MKIYTQSHIRRSLNYRDLSVVLEDGFRDLAHGKLQNYQRTVLQGSPSDAVLGLMPARNEDYMTVKIAGVSYDNPTRGLDSHQGITALLDSKTGKCRAVFDASELTAVRTAAVSDLAVRKLGVRLSKLLPVAVIGCGVQAYHHIKMFYENFGIKQFVVVSRYNSRVKALQSNLPSEIHISHRPYQSSLVDCEIVVTSTHATEIVLRRDQLAPRALVIAIGACRPEAQELDGDILDECLFVADAMESVISGSGEGVHISNRKFESSGRAINTTKRAIELKDVLLGPPTKFHDSTLCVFKSVGLSFEDLLTAKLLYESVSSSGEGSIEISNFGGSRVF
jgi:ornithine cyclodeaminase/alanine dehydrogenase-like protein (mu-crystallin family)